MESPWEFLDSNWELLKGPEFESLRAQDVLLEFGKFLTVQYLIGGMQIADAEDLSSETVIHVLQKLDKFKYHEPMSFVKWARKIATNRFRNWLRDKSKGSIVRFDDLGLANELASHQKPNDYCEAGETATNSSPILDALASLSSLDQAIIRMIAFMGLNATEVGDELLMTPASVRKRYQRAKNKLRSVLVEP